MRNLFRPNKFDAPCKLCGEIVLAGTGLLFAEKGNQINHQKTLNPVFVTQHKKCKKDIT